MLNINIKYHTGLKKKHKISYRNLIGLLINLKWPTASCSIKFGKRIQISYEPKNLKLIFHHGIPK